MGGLPEGRSTLLAGSTGTGKTVFGLQFLVGGARLGEPGVLVTFAERPEDRHRALNFALQPPPIGGSGLSITGDSYRMRARQDAINALRPAITGGEFP